MNFIDFFKPENPDHILALHHRITTGKWEDGFLPEGTNDSTRIAMIAASRTVEHYSRLIVEEFRNDFRSEAKNENVHIGSK